MVLITEKDIDYLRKNNEIIIVSNNNVYNVTSYINKHPGGKNAILRNKFVNNYDSYNFHSNKAKNLWKKYKIGELRTSKCVIL